MESGMLGRPSRRIGVAERLATLLLAGSSPAATMSTDIMGSPRGANFPVACVSPPPIRICVWVVAARRVPLGFCHSFFAVPCQRDGQT